MARFENAWAEGDIVHVTFNLDSESIDTIFEDPIYAQTMVEDLIQSCALHQSPLYAYCVMPSHVHMLLKFVSSPSKVMQSIKGHSSHLLNQLLGRKGRLWQVKSWDVVVTSRKQFLNVCFYIWNNPVKDDLVKHPSEYRFSNHAQNHPMVNEMAKQVFP